MACTTMDDLRPAVLQTLENKKSSQTALRRLTHQLHALQQKYKQQGLPRIYTDASFDVEQIWSQLTMHTRAVLPKVNKELSHIQTMKPEKPPPKPPAAKVQPRKIKQGPVAHDADGSKHEQKQTKKKRKRKAHANDEEDKAIEMDEVEEVQTETEAGANDGKLSKEDRKLAAMMNKMMGNVPLDDDDDDDVVDDESDDDDDAEGEDEDSMKGSKGRKGRKRRSTEDDEDEDEDEDEEDFGLATFPETKKKLDPADAELLSALERYETKEKASKKKGKKNSAGKKDDDDAEAEAALTEMYGEGAFDPDDDLALDGENGDEEEEDEEDDGMDDEREGLEGEEEDDEGDGFAPGRKDSTSEKLSRKQRKGRNLEDNEADEEEMGDEGDVFELDADDSAARAEPPTLVDKLEAKMLKAKPWSMRGEIGANQRPVNSLLEDDFEVEHAMKQVPVITEEMTHSLEDRIRKRIQDKIFDDVCPKVSLSSAKDVTAPPLDAVKSSLSLVDLYEKDYLEKKRLAGEGGASEATPRLTWEQKEEKYAIEKWFKLSRILDALSHAHFVPHPVFSPDLSISSSGPALKLEEPTPTAVSNAQLMAPQDTYTPPSNVAGAAFKADEELTREDRHRIRRVHKADVRARNRRQASDQHQQKLAIKAHRREERRKARLEAKGKTASDDDDDGAAAEAAHAEEDEGEGIEVAHPKNKRVKVWHSTGSGKK